MKFLDRFKTRQPKFEAELHPDVSCIVVGDVHGCSNQLGKLLAKLPDWPGPLVFVGDLVDRGEDSASVLLQAMQASREFPDRVVCLRGNHEEMFLMFLDDPFQFGPKYLQYGGLQTLASFGVASPQSRNPQDWEDCRDTLREAMPEGMEAWLDGLPTQWSDRNLSVVHAGADPAIPMAYQSTQSLVWGHRDFFKTPRQDGVWIAHGHTIFPEPKVENGIISLDTGAYATGRLTAALIGDSKVAFVST